jgi:hypothetical protein
MRPPRAAFIAVLVGLVPSVLAFQSPALAPLARVSQGAGATFAPLCVRQHCRLLRARGGAAMLRAEAGANDLLVIGAGTLVEHVCRACSHVLRNGCVVRAADDETIARRCLSRQFRARRFRAQAR